MNAQLLDFSQSPMFSWIVAQNLLKVFVLQKTINFTTRRSIKCWFGLPLWLSSKESVFDTGATGDSGSILGQEEPLEKGMATHSSVLAQRIPWTEEPAGQSPWGHKELDMTEATQQQHWGQKGWDMSQ